MKQKLVILSAILGLLVFSNCQDDELPSSGHDHSSVTDHSKISLWAFKNETGISDFKAVFQIPLGHDMQGKGLPEDFAIDTLAIKKHMSETGETTYSFRIYPLEPEDYPAKKFNLIYVRDGNEWETTIVSFKLSESAVQGETMLQDISTVYMSKNPSSVCFTETYLLHCTLTGKCTRDSCDGCSSCVTRKVSASTCSGGGGNSPANPGNPGVGGGGPINPYEFLPNLYENPIFDSPEYLRWHRAQSFWQTMGLMNAQGWASENSSAYLEVLNHLLDDYNSENIEFAKWAVDYLRTHPNVTIEQFKNWFMTPREGKDFFYDEEYWENSNLSFSQQDLPSWDDFESAYPTQSSAQIYGVVGGEVAQAQIDFPLQTVNGCALKVSRALNYSGITIPQITTTNGYPGTLQGADGKYYFLNAKSLNKWMKETFGTFPDNPNHYHFTAEDGGINGENFPTLVAGLKGIFSMVSNNPAWSSGHADILENSSCLAGCHFQDSPVAAPIEYIDIWILE